MFPDSDSWFRHELDNHRAEWSCQFCSQQHFDSSEKYEQHLRSQHEPIINNTHIPTLLKTSEQAASTIKSALCPFCNPEVGDENLPLDVFSFQVHVKRHMQQLALFALPRVSDIGDESWESDKAALITPDIVDNVNEDSMQRSAEPKDPPLHVAAYQRNGVEIMHMLKGGHNIDATGSTWGSVLGAAIAGGHPAIVKLLVESGADLHLHCNINRNESTTALKAALATENTIVIKILVDAVIRNQRLLEYGDLKWKLESVAIKLETLESRYDKMSTKDLYSNNVMLRDGYVNMDTFANQGSRISTYLRTIGTNLDPESDTAASNLKNIIPFVHIFLDGLETFHVLVDFLFDYFYVDTTYSGPLTLAAHHCVSHFNDSVIQTIRTKELDRFITVDCENIADILSWVIDK